MVNSGETSGSAVANEAPVQKKRPSGPMLSAVLAGVLALLVAAAISAPVALDRWSSAQDANAKDLLLDAAYRMRICAERAGGSYAGCDEARMEEISPSIDWREGAAPYGWGEGSVDGVYVDLLGQGTYRLETTSGSGRVFTYSYSGGMVSRTVDGGTSPTSW